MMNTSGQREIFVCHDGAALAAEAAGRIVAASQAAIAAHGRFTLVLSGGSTPEQTYTLLARPDWKTRIDWSHTWIFFGDERAVAPAGANSNYRMAARALWSRAHRSQARVADPDRRRHAGRLRGRTNRNCDRFLAHTTRRANGRILI